MAKSVRFNFNKGIYGGLEPRIVGDGFAAVIHNVDQRSGIAKPAKAPVLDGSITVAAGTKWMWEFLGTWYTTPEIRDWAGEKVGSMTRVYFTIPDQSVIPPQKIIDGVQAKLGTVPPANPPDVAAYTSTDSTIITLSAKIDTVSSGGLKKASNYRYRIAGLDASGNVMAVSNTVQAVVTYPDTETPHLYWEIPEGLANLEIYRSDAGDLSSEGLFFISSALANGPTNWVDGSTNSLDFSKTFPVQDTERTPYRYLYTYLRDINGHTDESGPSPISEAVEGVAGRVITFEATGEGTFTPDAAKTFASPVATPLAGTSISAVRSFISNGGTTTVTTLADHGLETGEMVRMTSAFAGDASAVGMYQVTVPVSPGRPAGFDVQVLSASGGTISAGSHVFKLVGVRGWSFQVGMLPDATGLYGGMTLPSLPKTVPIASGDTVKITVQPMDVDAYYLYMDDVLVWAWDAWEVKAGASIWTGSNVTWAHKPSLPTVDTSSSRVFKINATLELFAPRTYPGMSPVFDQGGGVQIATAAHGLTVGSFRSVSLSGFVTNASLNVVWVSEVTGATTVKIKAYMTGASETGGSAAFATVSAGATKDETANIKARRLYRIGDVTDFLRVAEIDIAETSFTDNVKTVDLGPACPSFYEANGLEVIFAPPPATLHGLVASGGVLGGLDGHKFRWTPVNYPDAWPEVFYQQMHYPVKAVPIGGSWIIFCAGRIGRLEMGSPTQTFFQWLPVETGCTAPYSIQATPKGIIFLGQEGLCLFDVGSNQVVPLFPDRLTRRFFLAPSKPSADFGHWWIPGNHSFAYTFLTRNFPGTKRAGMVSHLDDQPTWPEEWKVPRSFYSNGRYYLYYWDENTDYRLHGMLEVSLEGQQPVARLIGLRPMASHVTAVGNAYLLLPGSSGSLSSVLALEGEAPDTDTGAGSLSPGSPAVYRFGDELGTASTICIRTGPMNAAINERAWWKSVSFHGKGSGTVKMWLDGWDITAGGAAEFVATDNDTTSDARTVKLPRGACGYSLDLEIGGNFEMLACEITFDPMPSEG